MARRLARVRALLRIPRVEQTAACARALTGLVGRIPAVEILPAQRMMRATLTGEVLRSQDPVPWPSWMMRQLDPADAAFLPPMDIHPVLAGRDRTLVGVPGRSGVAWVDTIGWCGVGEGPSVTVWFGEGRDGYTIGRTPGRAGVEVPRVEQTRGEDGLGIITRFTRGSVRLTLHHWPVVLEGDVAWVLHARLDTTAAAPHPARLAFAVRPAGPEGSAPVFDLSRDADGLWTADGVPILAVARAGDGCFRGAHGRADPWHRFSGAVHAGASTMPGVLEVRCSAGQATAAEVYRTTLTPGEPFRRFAIIRPPINTPAALVRTTGESLLASAQSARSGLLASGATVRLERHQALFLACQQRLLLDTGESGLAGCLAAVALARMGFVRRAGARLGEWMARVHRDGLGSRDDPTSGAILAWSAAELVRWTQARGWRDEHRASWRHLLERLANDPGQPGGRAIFGPDGSGRWTAMWRAAALLSSAAVLRDVERDRTRWAMIGGQAREGLHTQLGQAPWSAAPGRVPDGSAAGMLTAAWLGLIPNDDPAVLTTVRHLIKHHWHGGGVLLRGGAHPASTALLTVVAERGAPGLAPSPLDALAALASPTGSIPTARHPARGALGEGDDLFSAALFVLIALDRVRAGRNRLTVLPDLVEACDLPTPFGRIDVEQGTVRGRWSGPAPEIEIVGRGEE